MSHQQCVLEIFDPLTTPETVVGHHLVPLESDLTTPLAYFLSNPELDALATAGLLKPETLLQPAEAMFNLRQDKKDAVMGLYMVQPYEPGKIPVVLVHGLWSSPMTWMEMFNDLRSSDDIRDHYQFWFYLYPSSQPFWLSAMQMRRDLAEVRQTLDPNRQEPALDQMVLIGHSMGGLVSELQTINSNDDYWHLVSKEPLDQIKDDPADRERLAAGILFSAKSLDPPRDNHCHAAPGQPFFQPDHAMAAGQADQLSQGAYKQPAKTLCAKPGRFSR